MGRYTDLARQIPLRSFNESVPTETAESSQDTLRHSEQHQSLERLIAQGAGYIQISCKDEEIYIALTDTDYHDLRQREGLTVYHAAHLILLTDEEIRTLNRLRTIGGPGGSMEIA